MNPMNPWLLQYNELIKENYELYRNVTKQLKLSESAFWILYTLREGEGGMTQKDIVKANHLPTQTINTALKKLEIEGYLELKNIEDKRKKQIFLTKKGEELAKNTSDRVVKLEMETLESFTKEEQKEFLRLFQKYTEQLKENFKTIKTIE